MMHWEQALLMVLILFYLADRGMQGPNRFLWAAPLSVLLAFLPPGVDLLLPEKVPLALVIPFVIWAIFQNWITARWRLSKKEGFGWLVAVVGPGLVLGLEDQFTWIAASVGGLILATMLWQTLQKEGTRSRIPYVGPLLLIFLLTEAEWGWMTPRSYLGNIFSGAFIGILLAGLLAALSSRLSRRQRDWATLIQVYLAYWLALVMGISAVAAALASVAVYTELKIFIHGNEPEPGLDDSLPDLGRLKVLVLLVLLYLGWQTELPIPGNALLISVVVLIAILILSLAERRLGLITLPEGLRSRIIGSGLLLATAAPLLSGLCEAETGVLSMATVLAGGVSFLTPALVTIVRVYRKELIGSSNDFNRREKNYWPARSGHRSLDDSEK